MIKREVIRGMDQAATERSSVPGWLGGTEMGELIFTHDWTDSGLGPAQDWPPQLQLAVNIMLRLPFAALLLWGENLVQIYNDGFRNLVGSKHPRGLGQKVSECWPEVWDFVEPACAAVMQRAESLTFDEQRFVLNRNGVPSESFFKLTYSPVPGTMPEEIGAKGGSPGGVLVTVIETTEVIQAREREAERVRLREVAQANRIQLLEEVFSVAPSFIFVLRGPDLTFEFANNACYLLIGQDDLIGRSYSAVIPESAPDGCHEHLAHVMATGKPFIGSEMRMSLARAPGIAPEERFIDLVYLPLLDEDGVCERVLAHGIDVTAHVQKRKKAEEALCKREEHFRRALEVETVGVIFFDTKGEITEANEAFLTMSGVSGTERAEGLLRLDVHTPPEWAELLLRATGGCETGGHTGYYEQEFVRENGSTWWAAFTAKQLNALESVGYVTEITRRKRAEQRLRESEARFRTMAEASPALTWQTDERGGLVYLNQRCNELMGRSVEELIPWGWRSILHPEDGTDYIAAFEQAVCDRSRFQKRVRVRKPDGTLRWLKSYALPWFGVEGDYAGHVGVSIDITDTVNAENALREAGRLKDEFLATLAHELRNPLAPVASALTLLEHSDNSAAVPHLLSIISRQVNYMVRLVDDLLEVSRITSGKVELRCAPTDLAAVLGDVTEACQPVIAEKKHQLSISILKVPLMVYADSVRLGQVFTNLLNNAARYTPHDGHIWLSAREEGSYAIVSVRDDGIGILPGMLPRLFDMFSQERRRGIGTQEGLGIGLNLVHRLVSMHGGTVEAMSNGKDQGSEFVVRLPLAQAPNTDTSPHPDTVSHEPEGLRLLVVDDNQDAAEVLQMLLASMGMNAWAVNSGRDALSAIPDFKPNVILMDIGMPGMSGHEVARHIRSRPEFNDITLVALTGWGQEEDRRQSKASGFNHHLTKPVDLKTLKELLASIQGTSE
ncbi:MAG TPA: PAS domain S-box protein [Nitrosospira sp.]|nr:PAS domain S-box protein [Nitrosospira sp.]